jgi:two-component system nitrogen regulation response regulator GlnG
LRANVRVIAATHQNLETRVRQGMFREDLYHRLNVIRLRLPALRERSDDIPLLAKHFLQKSARDLGVEPKRVTEDALLHLSSLSFPGNVRQLENLCNWLTVMAPAQTIEIKDLPPDLLPNAVGMPSGSPIALDGDHSGSGYAGGEAIGEADASRNGLSANRTSASGLSSGAGDGAAVAAGGAGVSGGVASSGTPAWEGTLRGEVAKLLREGAPDVMDRVTRRFEAAVIKEALDFTRGRKVEAAERLGIGRNTITRKIQELDLEP